LYRKHLLDLRGLGVRDFGFFGEDLWILAGPTMALDGPVALYRWRTPFAVDKPGDTLTREGARLKLELMLPFGTGKDHAESFALFERTGAAASEVLVIHDSPSKARLPGDTAIALDVYALP
jgi:hypothetical protein